MTPARLRQITTQLDRKALARLLGYSSENSLRQCEAGKQSLPLDKAAWLEGYARMRAKQATAEAAWLGRNPPPPFNAKLLRANEPLTVMDVQKRTLQYHGLLKTSSQDNKKEENAQCPTRTHYQSKYMPNA